MFLRDIAKLPTEISRKEFVDHIFEIGYFRSYECETLIIATNIGDYFVNTSADRKVCTWCNKISEDVIMNWPILPEYSLELAHVCLIISAKYNEDFNNQILDAADEIYNGIVYKMEWEILMLLDFTVPSTRFLGGIISKYTSTPLGFEFFMLAKLMCLYPFLQTCNPLTIILARKMLNRKAKSRIESQQDYFFRIIYQISLECETSISNVISAYIKLKS